MLEFIKDNWANILLIIVGSFALATYILQERKKKIDAASLIVLQIDEFQERLREISTFIVDGQLNETAFYESLPLMDTDYWNKYKHYFVRKMDATSYTALNQLYEYVSEIQEQQMLMKAFQKNSFQITQNVLANIESQFIVADLNNACTGVTAQNITSAMGNMIPQGVSEADRNTLNAMVQQIAAQNPNFDMNELYKDPMFNPIMQYEQAFSYYRYLCMQMDYKIKCKEYEKLCASSPNPERRDNKNA